MKENLRNLVLETLLEAELPDRKAGDLIRSLQMKYAFLEDRDRAFLKRVSEGTIERRITLDYVIDRFSRVKTEKMKPVVRETLRLSVFQLLYMDHVPVSAVCNEAVKLVKARHMNGLAGFVNGVLRRIAAERPDPDSFTDLSVRYSMPVWIVDRLRGEYGDAAAEEILKASLESRPLYIRVNRNRTSPEQLILRLREEGAEAERVPGMESALLLRHGGSPDRLAAFREGLFSVQDLSSQEAGLAAAPGEGALIIDVCAAPGGKACHLAELLKGTGQVEARDLSERKVERIRENRERLGLSNLSALVRDGRQFTPEREAAADLVVADLPCSGLGVMGRKNDLKYRIREEDIPELVSLQREILTQAVRYRKRGGRLLFSVCTLTGEETLEQRDWIRNTLGLSLIQEKLTLPRPAGPDGFYYAVFG